MPTASYLSRRALAIELMISESTLIDYVRRGLLPPPIQITPSCLRWRWETVDEILRSGEAPRWSTRESSEAEDIAHAIEAIRAARQPKLQDRVAAEGYALAVAASQQGADGGPTFEERAARAVAASRQRRNGRQTFEEMAPRVIVASKKRSRPAKKLSEAERVSRLRSNLTQGEAEVVARAITASKERSRSPRKPKAP